MSEVIEQEEVTQTEAEEMASVMAGYNARGNQPPAEPKEASAPEPVVEAEQADPVIDETPAEPSIADELAALKARVKSMHDSSDPDAVRRLHGEIGNINRTILQMQSAPKADEPSTDEVSEAMAAAEKVAQEFEEIGGPMVRALKALASRQAVAPQPAAPPVDIDAVISKRLTEIREREAAEALAEDHPDFESIRDSSEFNAWLDKKTPEEQHRLRTTLNPAVAAKTLTDYKASLAQKQKKQDRLAAAVTPQGVPQQAGPSVIPDEQGFANGYYRKRV